MVSTQLQQSTKSYLFWPSDFLRRIFFNESHSLLFSPIFFLTEGKILVEDIVKLGSATEDAIEDANASEAGKS